MATSTHGSRSSTFKFNETTFAPTVNDDSSAGYVIGSTWIDTTADKYYVCTDTTVGAAVWKDATAGAASGDVIGDDTTTTVQNVVAYNDTGGKHITELTGTQGDVLYYDGAMWAKLGAGTSGNYLRTNGAAANPSWATSLGALVYVATPANTAINSVTDVTIVTRDVTGVAAGDQLVVDGSFVILNNSGATRAYVITIDFDALFDIEITTGALATSATLQHPFFFRSVLSIRSTSLCYQTVEIKGFTAAGMSDSQNATMVANDLRGTGWASSASDVTGTTTVALFVRSPDATATQTLYLHNFTINKFTPT